MEDILKRYFYGDLSLSEEQRVQAWLSEQGDTPEVQEALKAIMYEQETEDRRLSADAFKKLSAILGIDRKFRMGRLVKRSLRIAAVLIVLLGLPVAGAVGYKYMNPVQPVEWKELKVSDTKTAELTLADGTHLYMNAGSRVTYPAEFVGNERRIFVEGEVYAEVAKNPEVPFVIASGDVDVTVLGTTFNFKAYDNTECVELLLLDGAVQVDIEAPTGLKHIDLCPGEMVQYDRKTGEIGLRTFNPSLFKGFFDNGSIHFFNIRLRDIACDLERLFGTKVVILDETLAETRYFAWFTNNESLEQILQGINEAGKMTIRKKDEVIYISKK